jgi:hypothetical protein
MERWAAGLDSMVDADGSRFHGRRRVGSSPHWPWWAQLRRWVCELGCCDTYAPPAPPTMADRCDVSRGARAPVVAKGSVSRQGTCRHVGRNHHGMLSWRSIVRYCESRVAKWMVLESREETWTRLNVQGGKMDFFQVCKQSQLVKKNKAGLARPGLALVGPVHRSGLDVAPDGPPSQLQVIF